MASMDDEAKLGNDSKKLAILIYDFLLEERCRKNLPKKSKDNIDKAADALEKVYKIKFTDYVLYNFHALHDVFKDGIYPIPMKNKIAAEVHKRRGNDFMNREMYKYAESEYTLAVRLNPRNAIYYCNRAAARIRQSLFTDAISDCNKALELDRSYVKVYGWLGLAHAMMENPGRAVRCFRKALRIEPENKVCIQNMDLINRKINHTTFRVLEPWNACCRSLARIVNNMVKSQPIFRRKSDNADDKMKSANKSASLSIEKFNLENLD